MAGPSSGSGGAGGDRLPPQNLEAERSVLGSILLDNDAARDRPDAAGPGFLPRRAPDDLRSDPRPVRPGQGDRRGHPGRRADPRDQFEKIGGDETLTEIVDSVPHAANAKYYAGIVQEKAINRQLIDSATEIIRDGYSNQFTAQELLESAERKVFAIAEEQIQGDTLELKDVVTKAMDRIADARRVRAGTRSPGSPRASSIWTTSPAASSPGQLDRPGRPAEHGQDRAGAQYLRPRRDRTRRSPSSSSAWRWATWRSPSGCSARGRGSTATS